VRDVGVVAGVDGVVVERGRAVAAVSRRPGLWAVVRMVKWHHFFSFGCANMTKWSVRSLRIYKPLLFVFFPLGMSQYYFIVVIITFHYNLIISVIVCRPTSVRTGLNRF
jgi:hypothetical protein